MSLAVSCVTIFPSERETLLKQELEFCRKYSYLCMVRYPKSIAYGFQDRRRIREYEDS